MPNVNKVTVMGVLGRDPETKQFPNGGSVTTFSVATTEFWKDKATGERKEATEWHRITTSNRKTRAREGECKTPIFTPFPQPKLILNWQFAFLLFEYFCAFTYRSSLRSKLQIIFNVPLVVFLKNSSLRSNQ